MERNLDKIELRSEKTRHVIGRKPPVAVRYGTGIVTLFLVVLLFVVCHIPYRKEVAIKAEVKEYRITAYCPDVFFTGLHTGMTAKVEWDSLVLSKAVLVEIIFIDKKVRQWNGTACHRIDFIVKDKQGMLLVNGQKGNLFLQASWSSVFHYVAFKK